MPAPQFPLNKKGGAKGAGVVFRGRKAKEIRCRHMNYAALMWSFPEFAGQPPGGVVTAVTSPPPPLLRGNRNTLASTA